MIDSRWRWILKRWMKRLWVRATLFCVLGVVTALVATVLSPYVSYRFGKNLGSDAVESILTILASSMLTVTVFSLSTMVAAATAAANGATPRASRLLLEDSTAQSALSTFLGGFLFSLVGIIALNTNYYGDGARSIMFFVTLAVIGAIVARLLQWIDYLASLGRVGDTIDLVEKAAAGQIENYCKDPHLGGSPTTRIPEGAIPVYPESIGYVLHLDMGQLATLTDDLNVEVFVDSRPGRFIAPSRPLAWLVPSDAATDRDDARSRARKAFTLGEDRSYEQDPRFGLIVLCEIGCRALSPAINDSGTAIDVIGTLVRVLAPLAKPPEGDPPEVRHPRVHVPGIAMADFFEDAFLPLARDGASRVEIGIRLQKAMDMLACFEHPDFQAAARVMAASALERGRSELTFTEDRRRLEREAAVECDRSDVM